MKANGTKRRAAKPGKKRAKTHESSKTKHQTKVPNEESQPIKSRRKLRKKGKKEETSGNVEAKISLTVDAGGDVAYYPVHPFDNSDQKLDEAQSTAIQMTHDNIEHAVNQHQQSFKAEQRRLEIERKRAEKKKLERLKKEEEEKNLSLLNEQAARTSSSDIITEEEEDHPVVHESVLTQLNVGDGHQEVLAELEEAKLREQRLLLAYSGESIEKNLCDAVDSAEKSIKKAKEAEEKYRDAERLKLEQDQKRCVQRY